MEQFEKWKGENCDNKGCPHEAACNGCENIWRAAMEQILLWGSDDDVLFNKIKDEIYG